MDSSQKTKAATATAFGILISLSIAHMLNDTMQSILAAVYPLLKQNLSLSFGHVGLIALTYQIFASIFQPIFGYLLDKYPNPWFLPIGMLMTMIGLIALAFSNSFEIAMIAVAFSGIGSSILHPEASRLTSLASGGRRGFAQSIFQVGGSGGFAFGPLVAAFFISPYGQRNIAIFALLAVVAIICLIPVCRGYSEKLKEQKRSGQSIGLGANPHLPRKTIVITVSILLFLIFSKYIYAASLSSFYTFYLMDKFDVSVSLSQIFLFIYLFAAALGTLVGGPVGDKVGRRLVIWISILGAAPFALMLPYANLMWTCILTIIIGFVMSSAFPAILVYVQELLPLKIGFVSGLFFGLAFGVAGASAAVLGEVADSHGIGFVYEICAYMPLAGIIAYFLPRVRTLQKIAAEAKSTTEDCSEKTSSAS